MSKKPTNVISTQEPSLANSIPIGTACSGQATLRILVLDHGPALLEQIASTLWVWPHHLASAANMVDAIRQCRSFRPTVLIATLDFFGEEIGEKLSTLRDNVPRPPIVTLGKSTEHLKLGATLGQGADAILTTEDILRPNLHNLLMRVRQTPQIETDSISAPLVEMPLPWRDSLIVGALVCDIDGRIITANECLATWLEFPGVESLIGKSVRDDLMQCPNDWKAWTDVAGDVTASLRQSIAIRSRNRQLLCMQVEVFAAPESPTDLQAMLTH